jgi:RNA polymerase sigma-B factor
MGSSLLADWELLQTRVIPSVCARDLRPATVWSIGDTNDAVVMTVAMAEARGSSPEWIRTYASPAAGESPPRWGDVGLSSAEVDRMPMASRTAWFQRRKHRWLPRAAISDQIILVPPCEPVDLVTVTSGGWAELGRGERIRDGGLLFWVDGPAAERAGSTHRWAQPVAGEPRLFRKVGDGGTGGEAGASGLAAVDGPTLSARLRQEELVLAHVELARSLARRFAHRGQSLEDLEQVALLALVGAARRYDAERGTPFAGYAAASVVGELKRHFRDRSWSMRVPRSLQELHLAVGDARDELSHRLGASPTVAQVAAHLRVGEEDVLEAMEAGNNYRVESLDFGPVDDDRARDIPIVDESFDAVLDRERLRAAVTRLDRRELVILKGLYFDERTQQDMATELGVSQMHVSRLAARAVAKLRH